MGCDLSVPAAVAYGQLEDGSRGRDGAAEILRGNPVQTVC